MTYFVSNSNDIRISQLVGLNINESMRKRLKVKMEINDSPKESNSLAIHDTHLIRHGGVVQIIQCWPINCLHRKNVSVVVQSRQRFSGEMSTHNELIKIVKQSNENGQIQLIISFY